MLALPIRQIMLPNCLFSTLVPNCPLLIAVPNCPRCQIVLFYITVPNCPGAKLSLVPNCPRCRIIPPFLSCFSRARLKQMLVCKWFGLGWDCIWARWGMEHPPVQKIKYTEASSGFSWYLQRLFERKYIQVNCRNDNTTPPCQLSLKDEARLCQLWSNYAKNFPNYGTSPPAAAVPFVQASHILYSNNRHLRSSVSHNFDPSNAQCMIAQAH